MPYKLRKAPNRELYWIVNKDNGHKYSKKPLPREDAVAQMRALYASEAREELTGEGWLSDVFGLAKKAATTVVQRVVDVSKGKRLGYSPKVRAFLAAHGSKTIEGMRIRRDPIRSMLHTAINAITLGRWAAARKKYAYDKVFHLGLELRLKGGPTTIVEKNEVIYVGPSSPENSDSEVMELSDPGSLTLGAMLDNTQRLLGDRYFTYAAFENNCQDFIIAILRANNLWTPARNDFVKQPLEEVIKDLPSYTGKLANVATDLAAIADVAIQGRGKRREAAAFLRTLRGGQLTYGNRVLANQTYMSPLAERVNEQRLQQGEASREAARKAKETPKALKGFLDTMDVAADIMENLPVVGNVVKGVKAVRDITLSALDGGQLSPEEFARLRAQRMASVGVKQAARCPPDRIYDPEKEYAYGDNVCVDGPDGPTYVEIPDPNDPKETCFIGHPNGPKRNFGVMPASECSKIQAEGMRRWEESRTGTDKFFDGLLTGLTTIGDIGADAISNIPGIGKIAANVYQQFAPPGSAYYQPDKATGEKIVDTVRGVVGLGKGQNAFLREARRKAKAANLNWQSLRLSDKAGKKLMITAPDGRTVHFGAKGMGDFIHYKLAGDPTADQHRRLYRARATKIRGDWAADKYSPNSLAIAVLW